jgi:hypothetical protein
MVMTRDVIPRDPVTGEIDWADDERACNRPARPQPRPEDALLSDALGILHRFATENVGWRGYFRRWYFSDEPLRHDAANLVRRAGFEMMRPEHTRLVGADDA